MTCSATPELRRIDRSVVRENLDQLSDWLLPGASYGVQHTWPQLFRSDGGGTFLAAFADDRMISHCAFRAATARTSDGPRRIALLGSVATDPAWRGRGLASRLLSAALDDCRRQQASAVLLWAQRPDLYGRAGFSPGPVEEAYYLDTDRPDQPSPTVRLATIEDHARLHELHEQKELAIERDLATMSGLLTTPGMWTWVLERHSLVAAYACIGKGADLPDWWHEFGGSDADVAALLPVAAQLAGLPGSHVLWPSYRRCLSALLGDAVKGPSQLRGPMVCALDGELPSFWVDGLDSV